METFFVSLFDILNEMSPYILLGFLIAGLLNEFVKPATMSRHLAGRGWKPVVKAAMLGVPLPLCSCGVLPTAVGLRRQGASKGATTSFLIATPQTGVDSIAATYSLLGLPMAIMRPVAALVGGMVGGLSVNALDPESDSENATETSTADCAGCSEPKPSIWRRLAAAARYGLVDMVASVGKWLIIGLVIAALITVFVPDAWLVSLADRPLLAMLAMIVIAVPMYVCATGSIPIAMSLMMKGLNPGAAFVLLMAGPAANFASMMVLGKAMGRRATAIYVGSVVVTAMAFGLMVDYLLPASWFGFSGSVAGIGCCHYDAAVRSVNWFSTACSALLIASLCYAFYVTRKHDNTIIQTSKDMTKEFKIKGMNCNHCRASVEKAIAGVTGVEAVNVDLASGIATVSGEFADTDVNNAVTLAGFEVI